MKTNALKYGILLLFGCIIHPVLAQNTPQTVVYQGYVMNSATLQKEAVATLQAAYEADKKNTEALYQLFEAQYVLLNCTMATKDEELFDEYVDDAVKNGKKLLDDATYAARANALLSAIYGYKIAYSPMKGMFLGGSSSSMSEKAIELAANDPVAWLKFGSNRYNTPEMWGGNKEEALQSFEKAVALFEANPETLSTNFHYLDALAWLGIAYRNAGELEKAVATFEKAIAHEPNFGWVKHSLLPKAQNALK